MFNIKNSKKAESVNVSMKSIYYGHHKVTYKGIKAIRCPFDYVMYQMIIHEVQPDLIIEVGTNVGGGALYIADLLDTIGKGVLHTIDIVDISNQKVKEHERISLFYDGWKGYDLNLN